MPLRDRLLSLLEAPDYRPADEAGILKLLNLHKKDKKSLAHEIRLLLSRGQAVWVKGDRLALAGEEDTLKGRIAFRNGGSAVVVPEDGSGDVVQVAPEDTDVALHGDRVEVKLFAAKSRRRDGTGHDRTGRVTRVIARSRDKVVGLLHRVRDRFYVTPDDPRFIHDVGVSLVESAAWPTPPAPGDKVVVALKPWTQRHQRLEGEILERLGKMFEPSAELAGIFRKFDLEREFPPAVEDEAANLPTAVSSSDCVHRVDFRAIPTLTIDPDDAKDFDDALSLEFREDGSLRVGVHIADVSHYVKPDSPLDREARRRGNSTYLVGTVVPMLPEKLSNGLCSLVEAKDRLCIAALLTFDPKGRWVDTDFAKTVIRSQKRLTYKQAFALLFENDLEKIRALPLPAKHQTGSTGRPLPGLTDGELVDLQSWLRKLWSLASKLRKARLANGSLDLDMPEVKVYVDEKGYAERLEKVEHDESHQLIEEFMLAANEAVARLTRTEKLPSLYRVHDEPDADKLAEFRGYVGTFGVEIGELTERYEMVRLLGELARHPQGYTLRSQLLRNLRKAGYRASPDGHYGLAKKDYTHFTSPIRRYADLVVHRVVSAHIAKHQAGRVRDEALSQGSLESLGEHLTATEVNSAEAERESVKIKTLEFFERELTAAVPKRLAAIITDVRTQGLFVELAESMTFGFLPTESLVDDTYVLNSSGTAYVGRRSKRTLGVGTVVDVHVAKVDRYKRLIDFRGAAPLARRT